MQEATMNCPHCNKPIETHEPGEHLDRLFMKYVMKWPDDVIEFWTDKTRKWIKYFNPSTNIAQAMEGVEIHKKDLEWFSLYYSKEYDLWFVATKMDIDEPINPSEAKTPALAITRALVMWAMERGR